MFKLTVIMVLLALAVAGSKAQTANVPVEPREPVLPRAPAMAVWTITYRYKKTDSNTGTDKPAGPAVFVPDRIASVQVLKSGANYYLVATKTSGARTESWIINGREVTRAPGSPMLTRVEAGNGYDNFTRSDFEELSWLRRSYFAGVKKVGAKILFHFHVDNMTRALTAGEQDDIDKASTAASPIGATIDEALALNKQAGQQYKAFRFGNTASTVLLDAATQMPVEWDDGKIDRVYRFTNRPAENMVLPSDVAAEFVRWSHEISKK